MTRSSCLALLWLLGCDEPEASRAVSGAGAAALDPAGPGPASEPGMASPEAGSPEAGSTPGASCASAIPLSTAGASAVLRQVSLAPASALGCAPAAGAAQAYFELDLSAAAQPVSVQLLLDAPFAFEAALARGPCGDLRLEQCATPLYPDERSRLIAGSLQPDRYQILVSAAQGKPAGEVRASVSLGELGCSEPPANDTCAGALSVDTSLPVQSLSGTLACAQPELQARCANVGAADVFYELDLSGRSSETLLEVAVTAADDQPVSASLLAATNPACGEVWMCGRQFSARLPPGSYRLAVSQAGPPDGRSHPGLPRALPGQPSPFALRVQLTQPACSAENDTWQTAITVDPLQQRQRISGNTACGSNQLDTACYSDRGAPDLFYRLDLRAKTQPQLLRTENLLGDDTVSYLLLADADESVPQLAVCDSLATYGQSYRLAPRLYYLVVDGSVRNAGRFELELELSDLPSQPTACASYAIRRCLADSEPACAQSMVAERCLIAALECGLEPAALEAFCAANPGCCTLDAESEEAAGRCLEQWNANVMCE